MCIKPFFLRRLFNIQINPIFPIFLTSSHYKTVVNKSPKSLGDEGLLIQKIDY